MKTASLLLSLLLLVPVSYAQTLEPPTMQELEQAFRQLPPESRQYTGPLFWLHGDEPQELLEEYVDRVAEGGNGSFTTESRPHNDWLGPNWFRDVGICLAAAKRNGLKLWIFDEKWWPSQGVAGRVPPEFAAKQLVANAVDVEGPARFQDQAHAGPNYIATVAGRLCEEDPDAVLPNRLIDLTPMLREGGLDWEVPEGRWRIMRFAHQLAPGLGQVGGSQLSVDGMSQACVDWFLQTVYQPHYDHFKEDFGKTIAGFFYDEPETRGDWGTALNTVLEELGVDWKQAYVAYKFRLCGEAHVAARYQYIEARAETWGRIMYGGITRWCEERGVQSIGHFMEHSAMYRLQDFCAGDLMRVQKYSSLGGIDAVFDQFVMGQRDARDTPCWQTPKLGSSISHAYGAPNDLAMVEIFGARGQDLTYPEMKWWTDHMHVSGINFLIPHSFNPRSPYDTDCPPYFFNNGFEPRWPLYRVFADYTSRLNLMLTGGRHIAPVALLAPGQSLHVGRGTPLEQISESLQDALLDCDWIPFEVFENDITLEGQELGLREERFRVLIVPPVEVIPYGTLEKAKAFFENGGIVLAHDFLPTLSATPGRDSNQIGALIEAVWGPAPTVGLSACNTNPQGGRAYLLPPAPTPEQLQAAIVQDAGIQPTLEVIQGDTHNWLHCLHRQKAGQDVFFITNQNSSGDTQTFRLRLQARGVPECWDAMRNEISTIPFRRRGNQVQVQLTLDPNESILLVFQPQRRALPKRVREAGLTPAQVIPLDLTPAPAPEPPVLRTASDPVRRLEGLDWIWFPEPEPTQQAAPGSSFFRTSFLLPDEPAVQAARFTGTADNHFELFLDGVRVGQSVEGGEAWRIPTEIDLGELLTPGRHCLAIRAVNGTDRPNPAGLLGTLTIHYQDSALENIPVDASWKASQTETPGWNAPDFDDREWSNAARIAAFGDAPWGRLTSDRVTIHAVRAKQAEATCNLTDTILSDRRQVYLALDSLEPETAARITINRQYAGGFLSPPLTLNVTPYLQPGENLIRIEPFAPSAARLLVYDE